MSRMAQNHFLKLSVQLNKVLRPITIASDWYLTRKQLKFCSFQTMNEKNYTHTITPTFTSQRSLRIEKRKYIFRFKAIIWLNIIVPPKLKKGQETSASDALFFLDSVLSHWWRNYAHMHWTLPLANMPMNTLEDLRTSFRLHENLHITPKIVDEMGP